MIIKPLFSGTSRIKAAAATAVETLPKSTTDTKLTLPPSFYTKEQLVERNHDRPIHSIQQFISKIPNAVNQRKFHNIQPGSQHDPVAGLFR
jgi:hypothetical protein